MRSGTSRTAAGRGSSGNFDRYGWFGFTPDILQRLSSPIWVLIFLCPAPFLQGVLINGLLHFFIPAVERQFDLSSSEVGLISSAYDIAAVICLIPLATIGGRRKSNRAMYVGLGLIILGTGALMYSSPAYLSGPFSQQKAEEVCRTSQDLSTEKMEASKRKYGWVLFVGNFLHGVGATPIFSIAVTLIDDCFPIQSAAFYISIYYTMAVIGPLVGIICGGYLSTMSVNSITFPVIARNEKLEPNNPSWVGCWWLGFFFFGILCYITSIPLLGLPKETKEMAENRAIREILEPERTPIAFESVRQLPINLLRIVRNPQYLILTLAGCCEGIIFSGMAAFLTKLLLQQFGLTPKSQAIVKAVLAIPSSLIGMVGGGWVIKFFSMNLRQIIAMIMGLMTISFPCIGALMIYCEQDALVGFSDSMHGKVNLVADCNKNCSCDDSIMNPICGVDNMTYFSACHAGCLKKHSKEDEVSIFLDCKCIKNKTAGRADAVDGYCEKKCKGLPIFTSLVFVYQTLSFFCFIPIITCTLRVVHSDLRSLAVAMQWVLGRLLGTIPGPLIFGKAIDDSCAYWQKRSNGAGGSCLRYDNKILGRNLATILFCCKFVEIMLFLVALGLAVNSHLERMSRDARRETATSAVW